MDVTREQLVDALQEFHLWVTPDRTQTVEARSVFGTVQDPESFADGLLLALRANAAHEDGDVVDADICDHLPVDPEVAAMAALAPALAAVRALDHDARTRVMRWAADRATGSLPPF